MRHAKGTESGGRTELEGRPQVRAAPTTGSDERGSSGFLPALAAISAALLAGPAPTGATAAPGIDAPAAAFGIEASGAAVQQQEAQRAERPRPRELGIRLGELAPGPLNAVTDVEGVRVGHHTLWEGDSLRTGVTAVLPHDGNMFRDKVPAAVAVGNGFGKLVGSTQVSELGELETPILLTGTLSVFRAADALVDTMLAVPANRDVRSINPVVGETNDGWLSDIRARPVRPEHVRSALRSATGGPVEEGSVGAGTGTRALGWKGGIGTSSRRVGDRFGGYTVGVLVQTNYGGRLRIGGVPVWRELAEEATGDGSGTSAEENESTGTGAAPSASEPHDLRGGGSVMIVVATDAPLVHRELDRLAHRAFHGIARTGSWMSHGSGDYAIAFSVAGPEPPGAEQAGGARAAEGGATERELRTGLTDGGVLSRLFQATVEATEEAALNSLFRATTVRGWRGHRAEALPVDRVLRVLDGTPVLSR